LPVTLIILVTKEIKICHLGFFLKFIPITVISEIVYIKGINTSKGITVTASL
jgi:hypothetical protein